MRSCEIINDELGWHIQFLDHNGKKRCCLMDATDSVEAELEAMEEGFNLVTIVPKTPFP